MTDPNASTDSYPVEPPYRRADSAHPDCDIPEALEHLRKRLDYSETRRRALQRDLTQEGLDREVGMRSLRDDFAGQVEQLKDSIRGLSGTIESFKQLLTGAFDESGIISKVNTNAHDIDNLQRDLLVFKTEVRSSIKAASAIVGSVVGLLSGVIGAVVGALV